jgi:hypothetical protein
MRFTAVLLSLVVAACGAPVTATPITVPETVPADGEVPTITTVSCTAPPVFQSDATFGPPVQIETGSTWETDWATIDVKLEVPSGAQVDRWDLPAIDSVAVAHVVDHGLAALVEGSEPCGRFSVWSTGEIADAVSDALLGFLEGLKPMDQLAEHLAELEAADRPPTCPAGPAGPVSPGMVHAMLQCGGTLPVYPVNRHVPEGADPIEVAVSALVDGPSGDERESGLVGAFDGVDPKPDIYVELTGGELVIGFELGGEPWAPGSVVSTSAQSMAFMDALFATAFQFDQVDAVTLDTCIGEAGCAIRTTRSTFEEMQSVNWGVTFTEGCGFTGYWSDPSCSASIE